MRFRRNHIPRDKVCGDTGGGTEKRRDHLQHQGNPFGICLGVSSDGALSCELAQTPAQKLSTEVDGARAHFVFSVRPLPWEANLCEANVVALGGQRR